MGACFAERQQHFEAPTSSKDSRDNGDGDSTYREPPDAVAATYILGIESKHGFGF
jgi:hypothetical protein